MPPHDKQTKVTIQPQIQHMDFTNIHNMNQTIKNVRNWIRSEWETHYPQISLPIKYTVSKFPETHPKVLQQTNGYDCGVYLCHNANVTITYFYAAIKRDYVHNTPDYTILQQEIYQILTNMIEGIFKQQVCQYLHTSDIITH